MFLQLNHQRLDAYTLSRAFVKECYVAVKEFPIDEKYALTQQIKRAASSVCLNIAEGASRKSEVERKRYYEIARGSIIEIDAAFDLASDLGYCQKENMSNLEILTIRIFSVLSKLITATNKVTNHSN